MAAFCEPGRPGHPATATSSSVTSRHLSSPRSAAKRTSRPNSRSDRNVGNGSDSTGNASDDWSDDVVRGLGYTRQRVCAGRRKWSGSCRVAGQDVIRRHGSYHPSPAGAQIDAAALHSVPEGGIAHGADVVKQAPACVQAVETVRPQRAVCFIRNSGIEEESFKVRGGHFGLFSAGASLCHRSATAALFAAVHPATKGPHPRG